VTGGVSDLQRTDTILSGLAVTALLLLHFLFRPTLAGFNAAPDLLVGGLLLAALRLRAGHAATLGFVLGVLDGAMALGNPGTYALVLLTISFAAARSRDLLFADARFFVAVYLFVGTWLARTALALLGSPSPDVVAVVGGGLLTAAVTTVVCFVVDSLTSSALR
jgi:cell shape-determining protein MreD